MSRLSSPYLLERRESCRGWTFAATADPCSTPPHTHNGAAVYAQVINGSVISQMIHSHAGSKDHGSRASSLHDSGEFPHELLRCAQLTIPGVGIYRQGEMWYEAPGCQHVRSENVSDDEEAAFYANFIIDADKLAGLAEKDLGRVLTILDVDPRSPHFSPPAEVP